MTLLVVTLVVVLISFMFFSHTLIINKALGMTVRGGAAEGEKQTNSTISINSVNSSKVKAMLLPVNAIRPSLSAIIGTDVTLAIAKTLGLKEHTGFLVSYVFPGSLAEKAGVRGGSKPVLINGMTIKLGGDVILKLDNKTITKGGDISTYIEQEKKPGENVKLTVFRDGRIKEINVTVGNSGIDSLSPNIAAFGNNVYVVWQKGSTGNYTIFFSKSTDSGVSFSTPIKLSNSTKGDAEAPQIAVSGSNVYVVWQDFFDSIGNNEIFLIKSIDNGSTFSTPINLSKDRGASLTPYIAVSGSNVYVVWSDDNNYFLHLSPDPDIYDVYFTKSTDYGASFAGTMRLSNYTKTDSEAPQVTTSGNNNNNVYVVWGSEDSSGNNGIIFTKSKDDGSTFDKPIKLISSNNSTAESIFSSIAASENNNVYVVWEYSYSTSRIPIDINSSVYRHYYHNSQILFAKSINGGSTFDKPINLSSTKLVSHNPMMTMSRNNNDKYVVWSYVNSSGNNGIIFTKSKDDGSTFDKPFDLNNRGGSSVFPSIAAYRNNQYITWQDNSNSTTGNYEIFFKRFQEK